MLEHAHQHVAADGGRPRRIAAVVDAHAAVVAHGAQSLSEVPHALWRQRLQERPLFLEHRLHLAARGALVVIVFGARSHSASPVPGLRVLTAFDPQRESDRRPFTFSRSVTELRNSRGDAIPEGRDAGPAIPKRRQITCQRS